MAQDQSRRIKLSVRFENEEEKQLALSKVPDNENVSDFIRQKAFNLPPRRASAGAPIGNKNNPFGRRAKKAKDKEG